MTDQNAISYSGHTPSGLTNEEAEFVYSVEVLGLPIRKAATMSGMSLGMVSKPHIIQARELTKR